MDNNHEVIGVFWRAFLGFCKLISSGKNGHHFADDTFERIFLNEIIWISNKISLKYITWDIIDKYMSALIQIMGWRRPGDKPLYEPMLIQFSNAYMWH